MNLKIYFGDKPVFLCDDINKEVEKYEARPHTLYTNDITAENLQSTIEDLSRPGSRAAILFSDDINALKDLFWSAFTVIKAGGGVVENENGEILMIFRRGKWDLPKGKLDEGESIESCALREVSEETGIQNVELGKLLLITYHTYHEKGKHILKETYWYQMKAANDVALVPQAEEDINAIEWVPQTAIKEKLENSFPSIVDVLKLHNS